MAKEVFPAFDKPKGPVVPESLAALRINGPAHIGMAP